ncbi:hypothetical protein [Sebaldella sp. S0638]|uniref:hypothetical protein n=1 Tax=Sebaldella sp. S0638 TaxID=2957809 RepID=UPI00209F0271|nr:hypothetical protein [Sebaldella sp. S0638]MCP1225218.1 hypothetical protein [Sebaldella sp. S0638]
MNKIILAKNRKVEFPKRIKLTEPDTLENYIYDLEFDPGLVTEPGTNIDANLVNLLQKNSFIDVKCNTISETEINSNLESELEGITEFTIFQGMKIILVLETASSFNKPIQLKFKDTEDETSEIPVKIYNNGALENVNNLPVGIYQMIYINGAFILISDTSSGGGSSSDLLYDEDVTFESQNQMGTVETEIYIPNKYTFINIIVHQFNGKRGNIFSRELLESQDGQFFNLLPFGYDDFTVSVNTKNNYLVLQSYYALSTITHLKIEGIK